ncbi:MAG: hypothetical protein HQM10_18850, partial [Candidatus Riflebacteria bacterium]|nr:hypothetical protein [Candidatus Riflebacteria bacterium]
ISCERLRERYGVCKINDWIFGGHFKASGFREDECRIGAELSQHRFGRAADLKFEGVTPEEIRKDMRKKASMNPDMTTFQLITCVEDGTDTWLHIDVRNHDYNGILWIPKTN